MRRLPLAALAIGFGCQGPPGFIQPPPDSFELRPVVVSVAGAERRVDAALVAPSFFTVPGVLPLLGRRFTEREYGGGAATVILSEALWESLLERRPDAIGRPLSVDGEPKTLVGVMPPGFAPAAGDGLWMPR